MRIGYDFSLDWCSFPPIIILLPSGHHHTAWNSWMTFRVHFSNVHSLPLSITKFLGDWILQTHFVLMHACLERTTFFSLLIIFILPYSCILCFNIKPSSLSHIHVLLHEKYAFSCIAAVLTARKTNQNQRDCLAFKNILAFL